ncbi:hypothetical protein B9Z55_021146 [Caenorhabditis nigoni]|uniref:Lin-15A/B-like domain-containing protein n=1 Tax=Caenorhabditis nigoni TaxID=1611254 RepID=A0A2G5TQS5_9PELO|nr:hypothetical protein B9Z55_021146 [Caenorhabditis nigoni]
MVIMIGCILRCTHSVKQAVSYITDKAGGTCYSDCEKTIDEIFEYLGVTSIQEFLDSSVLILGGLMNIAKKIDSNFTIYHFIDAFKSLFLKNQQFHNNL